MKVLLLSLFHPELVRGGAQQICYELFEGLKERDGIEPVLLCAIEPRFTALYKSGARITGFDNRPNEYVFLNRDYDYVWNKAANPQLIEAYAEFLEMVRPDVVHFHHFLLFGINLLPLTRRILPDAKLVFTFHEFLSICAADGQMVRRTDRSLCSSASGVRCHQCLPDRSPDFFFLREMWMKKHLDAVDVFTTPTRFMVEHYADGDVFDSSLEPGWAPMSASGLAQWGPPATADFLGTRPSPSLVKAAVEALREDNELDRARLMGLMKAMKS